MGIFEINLRRNELKEKSNDLYILMNDVAWCSKEREEIVGAASVLLPCTRFFHFY